jgi:steroid delta-isomerase-like uncharacterized protein
MMRAADLYSRWNDAMNRKDAAGVVSLYAPNAVVHDPAYAEPLEGRDAIERDLTAFFRTLPDLQVTVGSLLESDNTFAVEGRFEGTQTGPLLVGDEEIPASGRHVEFAGAGFYRLDGRGRILEERRYYDLAGMLSQIGVLT